MMFWAKTGPVLLAIIGIAASVRTGKRSTHLNNSPHGSYNHQDDSTTNNALTAPPYRYISSYATEIPHIAFPVEKKTPFSFKAIPAVAVTLDRSATIAIPTTVAKPMTTGGGGAVASAAAVPLVAPFPISVEKSLSHYPVKILHPVMPLHQPLLVTKLPIFYQGTFPHLDGTLPHHFQNYAQPYQ